MTALRINSWKKEISLYLWLGLPTLLAAGYVLKLANEYFAFLENNWLPQTLAFGAGMAAGFSFFTRRFRFVTITALLLLSIYLANQIIGSGKVGEFDGFFWTVRFSIYAFCFVSGWIMAYGFSRAPFFSVIFSVLLLAVMSVVVAGVSGLKTQALLAIFAPVMAYAFYVLYTSENIRRLNEDDPRAVTNMIKRIGGFLVLMLLLLAALLFAFKPEFEAVEKEWGGAGQKKDDNSPQNSLTKNDGTGSTTQNNMGLNGFNNKANKDSVLFVARLDNFFPESDVANPLYFVTDHYSRFDDETQTFEVDSMRPLNDLFSPDVSQIPLFYTKSDSGVLQRGMSEKFRRVASVEVYKHNLSARLFTAPGTSFYVQPIPVPDENKNIYRSAYKAKAYVSELNSAYFVYNPAGDASLEAFQQQRFDVLRKAKDYTGLPANFLNYYTYIPAGTDYDSIRQLSKQIVTAAKATSKVDQVIALRDYFLKKDADGQPTFRYSDNPGIPGIPSANKLTYFLFQNKKGYCAYYAGATLFMLRSLGIPSRITTGFLTVDRSNKNPGWYWFYEDQAHAWVQVYFPEYGWIDFDTTVPDAEQQQSPQPDQTPPLESQQAWLVANGKAISIDTVKKQVRMQVEKMLYWDEPYAFNPQQQLQLDVSLAKISRDTGLVTLESLQKGESIVAVSYAEAFSKLKATENENANALLQRFPNPAPIDEIKIMLSEEEKKAAAKKIAAKQPIDWPYEIMKVMLLLIAVMLVVLATPWMVYQYLLYRARNGSDAKQKLYYQYTSAMYYLHQMGLEWNGMTPARFARDVVDKNYNTRFAPMVNAYLKAKYSPQPLLAYEQQQVNDAWPETMQMVANKLPVKHRFLHFININRTIAFFKGPELLN